MEHSNNKVHKVNVADLNEEFSKLAKKLRSLGNQKDIIHECELFFHTYLQSDSPNSCDAAYFFFWILRPLVELSFEGDLNSPTIYYNAPFYGEPDDQKYLKLWVDFFLAFFDSEFIDGSKNRSIDVQLYKALHEFLNIAIKNNCNNQQSII